MLTRVEDFDRSGTLRASVEQRALVARLGARATWGELGAPASLVKRQGFLATGLSGDSAVAAARAWLGANKQVFGLGSLATLRLANDARLAGGAGHAVVFRQSFGALPALNDGTVTVGVTGSRRAGWKIAYVSSSLSPATKLLGKARLSPGRHGCMPR